MTPPKSRSPWVIFLLILLPLWLIASGGVALWYYFHREKAQAAVEQQRFAQTVSIPMLEDDLRKITTIIGERNTASEVAATNLSRAASMIEGVLGPSNTGYAVKKHLGPGKWPILQVSLKGKDETTPAVWVLASYDSPKGSRGAEANATGLAATLAAAQALAADKPAVPISFLFIPHSNEQGALVEATAGKLAELSKAGPLPKAILCIEAMGAREELFITPSPPSQIAPALASGLGHLTDASGSSLAGDPGLTGFLARLNLPAVRVSTSASRPTPDENEKSPFPPTVAASTGRLIELIRRCAAK